jgi:general secretion pathway protein D
MKHLRSSNRLGIACMAAALSAAAFGVSAQQGGGFGTAAGARTGGASTRTYTSNTQVGEAIITSDPDTRSLVIVTDDETNENIRRVIESLDRPKPQVLINVVFAQVTHNNDLDFGVEGSYTHTANGRTGTGGTDFGLDSAARIAAGGGFYQILSDDVNLLIRALEVAGKTEILSRPSILARNNQQATITVGQEVPLITNTRTVEQTGDFINTVSYREIGIILRVTPFITPDGMVEMIVSPEISTLAEEGVDIGGGAQAPIIDKRSADTVVVTESGRTIVIGGLIATQKLEQDRKVPVLGDIPLLGYAFKRKIKQDTKTELLIFMTPTVIQRPGDLARASTKEAGKLKMVPETFGKDELSRYVEGYDDAAPPEEPVDAETESLQDLRQRALEYLQQQQAQPPVEP